MLPGSWELKEQWLSQYRGKGGQSATPDSKKLPKIGKNQEKTGQIGKIRKKEGKSGRKGKNQEDSFTLPLLIERAGYTTVKEYHYYYFFFFKKKERKKERKKKTKLQIGDVWFFLGKGAIWLEEIFLYLNLSKKSRHKSKSVSQKYLGYA